MADPPGWADDEDDYDDRDPDDYDDEPYREPDEPDWGFMQWQAEAWEHSQEVRGGGECNCPPPEPAPAMAPEPPGGYDDAPPF